MSKVKAFTLIELLVVVVLIGIITFLVVRLPQVQSKSVEVDALREFLWPQGSVTLYADGTIEAQKDGKKVPLHLRLTDPVAYRCKNGLWEEVNFGQKTGRRIVFTYSIHSGLGSYFVLKSSQGYYVFKPLAIMKAHSLEQAKQLFLLANFAPAAGEYY